MGASFWNVVSLVTGILAWALPLFSLFNFDTSKFNAHTLRLFLSLVMCSIAIFGQLKWQIHLALIHDYSAIEDTSSATIYICATLLIMTIVVNSVVLLKLRRI